MLCDLRPPDCSISRLCLIIFGVGKDGSCKLIGTRGSPLTQTPVDDRRLSSTSADEDEIVVDGMHSVSCDRDVTAFSWHCLSSPRLIDVACMQSIETSGTATAIIAEALLWFLEASTEFSLVALVFFRIDRDSREHTFVIVDVGSGVGRARCRNTQESPLLHLPTRQNLH